MAHILNGDMVTLTLITGVMNTFVIFFAHIVSRIVASFLSLAILMLSPYTLDQ